MNDSFAMIEIFSGNVTPSMGKTSTEIPGVYFKNERSESSKTTIKPNFYFPEAEFFQLLIMILLNLPATKDEVVPIQISTSPILLNKK